jgi:hypothetical protein
MITLTRKEAQQVLDALGRALSDDRPYIAECKIGAEILRAKLSEPWVKTYSGGKPNYTKPIEEKNT